MINEEKALEIMSKVTKQHPAVGTDHQETVKTKAIRDGVQEGWNSFTDAQKLAAVAVAIFAFVCFLAIEFAPLMR